MTEINRSLIILKPKQPFLDWARTLDDKDKNFTLEELREDSRAFLLPEVWDYDEHQKLLKSCYDILFEEELEGWWTDETAWPKERDLKRSWTGSRLSFIVWYSTSVKNPFVSLKLKRMSQLKRIIPQPRLQINR